MPTGPGGLDSNGIWQFGEDDSEALASDLLNLGMASISTEVGLLDAAVAAIVTGQILQVVSTTKTDTFSASLASAAATTVTGLTATLTPVATSSKVFVMGAVSIDGDDIFSVGLFRDTTAIADADASGLRSRDTSAGSSSNAAFLLTIPAMFLDSPATTSEIEYSFKVRNGNNSTQTVYVNRPASLINEARLANVVSTITLMEVAG